MKELYELVIRMIKTIESLAQEYNLLDSQDYLNFKDTLNSLSLDLDRE